MFSQQHNLQMSGNGNTMNPYQSRQLNQLSTQNINIKNKLPQGQRDLNRWMTPRRMRRYTVEQLKLYVNDPHYDAACHLSRHALKIVQNVMRMGFFSNDSRFVVVDGLNSSEKHIADMLSLLGTHDINFLVLFFSTDNVSNYLVDKMKELNSQPCVTVYEIRCPHGYIPRFNGDTDDTNVEKSVGKRSMADDGTMAYVVMFCLLLGKKVSLVTMEKDWSNNYDAGSDGIHGKLHPAYEGGHANQFGLMAAITAWHLYSSNQFQFELWRLGENQYFHEYLEFLPTRCVTVDCKYKISVQVVDESTVHDFVHFWKLALMAENTPWLPDALPLVVDNRITQILQAILALFNSSNQVPFHPYKFVEPSKHFMDALLDRLDGLAIDSDEDVNML